MRPRHLLPYAAVLLALTGVVGCGASSPDAGPRGSSANAAVGAAAKTVEVTVTGSTVTPPPAQVELAVGQTLAITVTIDHDDELHAHGFDDAALQLKAGVPGTLELTGTEPGVYEVETHEPALLLLTVAVR